MCVFELPSNEICWLVSCVGLDLCFCKWRSCLAIEEIIRNREDMSDEEGMKH